MALKRTNQTLLEKVNALQELVDHLVHSPEQVALNTMHQLRASADPMTVIRAVKGDNISALPTLPKQAESAAADPSLQCQDELWLFVQHPNAYPTLDPAVDLELLQNPLFWSLTKRNAVDEPHGLASIADSWRPMDPDPMKKETGDSANALLEYEDDIGTLRPLILPDCIERDPRLENLNIAFWTAVPITNRSAATAISMYFESDGQILSLFDPDLFIKDLVDCRFDYCSSFLVNSLLAWILVCEPPDSNRIVYNVLTLQHACSSIEAESSRFSYMFEVEAERLWQVERGINSLTSVAGLVLLQCSLVTHGASEKGTGYTHELLDMATRMRLFGTADRVRPTDLQALPVNQQRALTYAAWGAFNTITYVIAKMAASRGFRRWLTSIDFNPSTICARQLAILLHCQYQLNLQTLRQGTRHLPAKGQHAFDISAFCGVLYRTSCTCIACPRTGIALHSPSRFPATTSSLLSRLSFQMLCCEIHNMRILLLSFSTYT